MSGESPNTPPPAGQHSGPPERSEPRARRGLPGGRITVAFVCLSLALVAGLSGVTLLSVQRVFDWLTPLAHRDLRWKTERGLAELGGSTELGILLRDRNLIMRAARDYVSDSEVSAIVVQDEGGDTLFVHQRKDGPKREVASMFRGAPGEVHVEGELLRAWSDLTLEGQNIGRLALAVSAERLSAGAELRSEIISAALVAGLLALVLSLAVVRVYVAPLIALMRSAFNDLEEKTREALEATRIKSEFIANVSHELRTPLNGILGMVGLLLRSELTPQQRRHAEIVEGSSQSLLALINDVLDFSKMEAGKTRLVPVDCDLRELVQNRIELLAVKAQVKQLELGYCIHHDVPALLRVDAQRLNQVLTNLVGNAVKFTAQGDVLVKVALDPPRAPGAVQLRFTVRDTGPGIARDAQAKLFRSFSQVDASAARSFEGTGLGLVISKHLVQLMGGEIGVESESGRGATFWFTFPAEVVEGPPPPEPGTEILRDKEVLLVDPSPMWRDVLSELVGGWGMRAHGVASETEALLFIERAVSAGTVPWAVLTDVRLPAVEGSSLGAALRRRAGEALRIVQLVPTWWARTSGEEGAFLVKPVRPRELAAALIEPSARKQIDAGRAPGPAARPARVLVVDDNEISRTLMRELLDERGHSCELAADGEQAVPLALGRRYDVIFMDCQMPGMSGYEAARNIRAQEQRLGRHTPIVALTAHASPGEEGRVRAAGMDGLITKPLSPSRLDAELQRWTGGPRTREVAPPPLLKGRRRSVELLELFLRTVPEQVEALRQAALARDAWGARTRAHRLKGSAGSIGAERMASLCDQIESECERGELDQLGAHAEQVARELPLLLEELARELEAHKRA